MFKNLKINTAIVICVAFLFRLFSLSIGYISTSNDQQASNLHSVSIVRNSNTQIDPLKKSETSYSDLEFSEEDSDDENEFKFHTSFLMELFYAPVQHNIIKQIATITPSNKHYISSSSQRHLEFGVFRI